MRLRGREDPFAQLAKTGQVCGGRPRTKVSYSGRALVRTASPSIVQRAFDPDKQREHPQRWIFRPQPVPMSSLIFELGPNNTCDGLAPAGAWPLQKVTVANFGIGILIG